MHCEQIQEQLLLYMEHDVNVCCGQDTREFENVTSQKTFLASVS